MEFDPKEITLIYNFDKQGDREAIAYAKQMASNVNEVDISKNPLTERQLAQLIDKLGVSVEKLIDVKSDVYKESYEGKDMDEADWLGVLKHNPNLMKTPIGILGEKSIICDLPSHILSLDEGQGYDQDMKT
ncbi:arsenate reductase [Catalinimonas alkaloidigena]|uniref:arsenate reductase family protein n=1 Tax=Catalinimonas alkaloidigena TaxID=1075417 RepID=UPI0024073DF7|nr:ArsC/Spx/MgsR family protein [Catalinimonas alkaloidigena]MDF9797426.1 arsenate reductase [Catalinimonas alkaloidigena]